MFQIILLIFILFIIFQIYFYSEKYKKNQKLLKKVESFENTLSNIDSKYVLDDNSLQLLLKDYNNLKNNIIE